MLDFNNLNYFPSLFEDLSKPRETYTIVQSTNEGASSSSAHLNNTNTSLYKRYTEKATCINYLENAIFKHKNIISIENTMVPSTTAAPHPSTDVVSYVTTQTKTSPGLIETTTKDNNVNSFSLRSTKVDLGVVSVATPAGEITAENIALIQNSSMTSECEDTVTQKTNTPSISYNLNRDSVSSTYSKYFYSEDTHTTDKVNAIQTKDKHVADTHVKLFVSEHTDNTENTKKYNLHTESVTPEPVTPEQVRNTDLSKSLQTNIKNSKLRLEP
jgi:hypothetical protein